MASGTKSNGEARNIGQVVQVIGPTVDVRVRSGASADDLQRAQDRRPGARHQPDRRGRAAHRRQRRALHRHELHRRPRARHEGGRHGRADLGAGRRGSRWAASSTCWASPIDQGPKVAEPDKRLPIHRAPPTFDEQETGDADLRDRHQGRRPAGALREGRQGRTVRRRRRRQDGHSSRS